MKKCLQWLQGSPLINRTNKQGFSLIELIITITLITLIALLAGSHLAFFDRLLIRAELEHLYVTCYLLQRRAMMIQEAQTLTCDTEDHSYRYNNKEYRLPPSVRFGTAVGVKGPPSAPEKEIREPVSFKDATITCTPEGMIGAGAIYLTDRYRRWTYALSCAVGHVSYLRKYQYTQQWVLLGNKQ